MATVTPATPDICKAKVVSQIYNGDSSKFDDDIFSRLQDGGAEDKIAGEWANVGVIAGVIGGIASVSGADFGQGQILGSLSSFYMQLLILKTLLHYLLPMMLMTIYMFWGLYMVVGEFKGMTMIRGMILIAALSLMPALWAVMEHLDDGLYEALYGGWDASNPADRLFLDVATSIFQIAIVFVLFFLISEAGGGNASGAVDGGQNMGAQGARGVGSSVGGAGTNAVFGRSNGKGRVKGGLLPKVGKGMRGGLNSLKK